MSISQERSAGRLRLDRSMVHTWLIPSILVGCLVLALTEAAAYAYEGREEFARIYLRLFIEDRRIALAAVVVLIIAPLLSLVMAGPVTALIDFFNRRPGTTAACTGVLLSIGAVGALLRFPLSADEVATVFQARIFAAGEAAAQMPPGLVGHAIPQEYVGFFYDVDSATGRVAANYWPGHALLMAPFARFGVAYLLNPLIGALSILAIHRLAARLFPGTSAPGLAVLFVLASPAFTFNAMSFFAMPAHLLANTLYVLLLLNPTAGRLLSAGAIGGYALLLHQPFPHALFALPWVLWLGLRPGGIRRILLLAAGYLPVLLVGGGQWLWLHAGIGGFGGAATSEFGQATNENPLEAVRYAFSLPNATVLMVRATDLAKIIIWSAPGLFVLATLGGARMFGRIEVRLLIASAGLMFFGYLVVFFDQGAGWGSRYFHPAWMVLPLLAAGFVATRDGQHMSTGHWMSVVPATMLASLLLVNGVTAGGTRRFMQEHIAQLPSLESGIRHVVVLNTTRGYYVRDLIQNDPFLRGPVIYLEGRGGAEDDAIVTRTFPTARLLRREPVGNVWRID
jgi:hypothetical protein